MIEIPENCEVVIPSNDALEIFFGPKQLKTLSECFKPETTEVMQPQLDKLVDFNLGLLKSECCCCCFYFKFSHSFTVTSPAVAAAPPPSPGELLFVFFPFNSSHFFFSLLFSVDPLFSNDEQEIDVEWMRKVFPDEKKFKKAIIEDVVQKLSEQLITTVGDLKELSKEDLERWGIPGAISTKLYNRSHPKT